VVPFEKPRPGESKREYRAWHNLFYSGTTDVLSASMNMKAEGAIGSKCWS
jgi:hypothetical protein